MLWEARNTEEAELFGALLAYAERVECMGPRRLWRRSHVRVRGDRAVRDRRPGDRMEVGRPLAISSRALAGDRGIQSSGDLIEAMPLSVGDIRASGVSVDFGALPDRTRLLLVNRPPRPLAASAPSATSGDRIENIRPPNLRGTVGFPVQRVDRFRQHDRWVPHRRPLRARRGRRHVAAVHARRFGRARKTAAGTVSAHHDPISSGRADWDIAVVEPPDGSAPVQGRRTPGSPDCRRKPREQLWVPGASCGTVPAAFEGALLASTNPRNRRTWRHCWMLTPSGVTSDGDSGAAGS